MSPQKWIKETNAVGIISKSGRYGGGTFAHSDIASKFAAWISAEFRAENPDVKGNIRDEATLEQLVVLSNLESINALLIRDGLSQGDRLEKLNKIAIEQLKSLLTHRSIKNLKVGDK